MSKSRCPDCCSSNTTTGTHEDSFRYQGHEITYQWNGLLCLDCGEGLPDKADTPRMFQLFAAFKADIDANRVSST